MNEKPKGIISLILVVAIALLLAFPFVPAFASDAGASDKKVSASQAASIVEEKAAAEKAVEKKAIATEEKAATQEKAATEQKVIAQADFEAAGGNPPVPEEPWEVTSLDISKDVDVVTAPGVEISLEKTASESYIEMMLGETKQVTFTIKVGAELSDSYYIAGNIFVQNTGDWPADVIAVSDTVWYKAGGPNWLAATSNITTTVPMGDNAIPTGGPHTYSYSGTFTLPVPLASVTAMSNLIEITISNKPDPPKPGMQDWKFHYREDFAKPVAGGSSEVMLEDIETIEPADGLSYEITSVTINGVDAASLTGPWALDLADAPFTIVIEKDLTADVVGTYILNNKAKIGDLEDDVDVEIVVKEPDKEYGSITGYKYEDQNISGELDEGEAGWAGITIELWKDGSKIDETVTDSEGMFYFSGLEAGDYEVKEVLPAGVANSGPLSIAISLEEGEHKVLQEYFLNYYIPEVRKGEIHGYKYVDLNADGILDEGEPVLAGVTIKLYKIEQLDQVAVISTMVADIVFVAETVTDENGYFEFLDLEPGEYMVEEVVPEGYFPTSQNPISGWVAPGQEISIYFLNARMSAVSGEKIDAITEEPIAGVMFVLEGEDFYMEVLSDENGEFDFGWLIPGEYHLYEIVPEGWVAVGAVEHDIILESGDEEHFVFMNQRLSAIYGTKWFDLNANGQADEGEEGLAGVTINLRDAEGEIIATTVSASDGSYAFEGLMAGEYTVEEVVGDGYVATAPISVSFELLAGEEKVVDFFNNVETGGVIITPPVTAQPGAQETLPVTGFEMSYLLIMIGLLILTGAFIASYGLLRLTRTR